MRRFGRRHSQETGTETALANFALTFAKALLVFCVVLFMMINSKDGKDGSKPKAEFLISVEWATATRYDVDTWVRLPNGTKVQYDHKESGVVFLERDDLGGDCGKTTNDGIPVNVCEEITVIRGAVEGEYQISLHLYSANNQTAPTPVAPVHVRVKIEKLNPNTIIVWEAVIDLDAIRQEKKVVRFTISEPGSIGNFQITNLPGIVYQ